MKPGDIVFSGKTKKGKEIVIRYPVMDDVYTMLDFINTLSKEETYILFQGRQQTLEEEKNYLKGIIEKIQQNKAVHLIVTVNGKMIGGSGIVMSQDAQAHVGAFGISVSKEHRGEGIGKKLMESVLLEAEHNIRELQVIALGVFENNPLAYEMYLSFGFKKHGLLPKGIRHKGNLVNEVLMYKELIR